MLKSTNNVETNVYELEITVDGEKFEAAVQKAYLKERKNITIKGFRKGKAPRNFIERFMVKVFSMKMHLNFFILKL